MLNVNTGKRELAYVVEVLDTKDLPNYDNVHYVKVLGWWCVATKDLKKGDKGVYFEIDSVLPESDKRFLFMSPRKYRVKTLKICKVASQGLVLPLSSFPELKNCKVGDFVTDKLGVTLYEEPSLVSPSRCSSDAWAKAQDRHKKFFSNPIIKFLMRFKVCRRIFKKLFCKKKDKIVWPDWLPKTNSERVQNVPALFDGKDTKWVASEKVDGASTSFILDDKNTYMVCSHNVVVFSDKVKGSEKIADGNAYFNTNIWIEMSDKYDIKPKLLDIKKKYGLKSIAIQGETYGDKVQRRSYGLRNNKHDLAVFHIWFDGKRLDMKRMVEICDEYSLPHVHIFDWNYQLPESVDKMIEDVDSKRSHIDNGMIEGFVLYSKDGQSNYKCVSPSFLLKYH